MKNKVLMNIITVCFFCVIFILALLLGMTSGTALTSRSSSDGFLLMDTEFVRGQDEGEWECSFNLPDEDLCSKYIAFEVSHLSVRVFIDGDEVYSLFPDGNSHSKSVGHTWNYIKLDESDAGKTMTVKEYVPFKGPSPYNGIYYGEKSEINRYILQKYGLHLALTFLIFIIGIFLIVYTLLITGPSGNGVALYFALFSIFLSVWAASGSSVVAAVADHATLLYYFNHTSLMLMPMAFILFIRRIFHNYENRTWKIMLNTGMITIVFRVIMDIAGILEFRQTLVVTQLYICFFVLHTIYLVIDEIRKNRISLQLGINFFCIGLVMAATVIELVFARFLNRQGDIGIICFLAYVLIMTVSIVKNSQKIRQRAAEAEIYRNLAFTDALTGTFSRTAFMNDMSVRDSESLNSTVVFMFDLNNLKKCNDEFGHENGDKYISSVAKAIEEVIGDDGRCYRIGGDEFSALVKYSGQNDIKNRLAKLNKLVEEMNREEFVVVRSVAAGYAVYDRKTDSGLEDTMKRADEMMYANKQKMKAAMAAG